MSRRLNNTCPLLLLHRLILQSDAHRLKTASFSSTYISLPTAYLLHKKADNVAISDAPLSCSSTAHRFQSNWNHDDIHSKSDSYSDLGVLILFFSR